MKTHSRRALGVALGLSLSILVSCGSDDADSGSPSTTDAPATSMVDPTTDSTTGPSSDPTSDSTVDPTADSTHDSTHGSDTPHDMPMVTVGLRDYAFDDVPASVALGTTLSITNNSVGEVHELVAVLLPETETRTAAELVALPPAELGALVGTMPAHVLIAPPGEPGFPAVGDGVLDEPGRYLLLCTIPIGADPGEYLAAAQSSDGPPQVAGGPPHFTAGMFGELVVEPDA